jgi:mannose-1-phosphate guanylyltransferase
MRESTLTCTEPAALIDARRRDDGGLWAVVLAGGDGARLRPLTQELYGDARPKQYAALTGGRSLLRETLDRVGTLVPPERTVVVTRCGHEAYLSAALGDGPKVHVLCQPADRGTAAGVLLPAHWIDVHDPAATVVVFPTDHFILEEALFMQCVAGMAAYAQEHPEWLVLLGMPPTDPEPDYGWIEPGERVEWATRGPVYRVRHFEEKPGEAAARELFARHWLWNTLVLATSAAALVDAGRQCVPLLHDRLTRLRLFVGTQYEAWALRQAYRFAPASDFSGAVLGSRVLPLAVAEAPDLTWCDLGTPERVARMRDGLGAPPWPGSGAPAPRRWPTAPPDAR